MVITRLDSDNSGKEPIEIWFGDFSEAEEFTVEIYETTYFEKGQKIKFYRVDE